METSAIDWPLWLSTFWYLWFSDHHKRLLNMLLHCDNHDSSDREVSKCSQSRWPSNCTGFHGHHQKTNLYIKQRMKAGSGKRNCPRPFFLYPSPSPSVYTNISQYRMKPVHNNFSPFHSNTCCFFRQHTIIWAGDASDECKRQGRGLLQQMRINIRYCLRMRNDLSCPSTIYGSF